MKEKVDKQNDLKNKDKFNDYKIKSIYRCAENTGRGSERLFYSALKSIKSN